jgi:arsenate reductase (glutaredoxin)
MTITLYGIPNCDTVKRARAWLGEHGVAHAFHDFKKAGVPPERLDAWIAALGWERLVNRSGTTWRKLDETTRQRVQDASTARELMSSEPSVIRRPVVEWGAGEPTVGFDAELWGRRLR